MKKLKFTHLLKMLIVLNVSIVLSGCVWNDTILTSAVSIDSVPYNEVDDRYALLIDARKMRDEFIPENGENNNGYIYNMYHIDAVQTFVTSTEQAFANIFTNLEYIPDVYDISSIADKGFAGIIIVEVKDLEMNHSRAPAVWRHTLIEAKADISINTVIERKQEKKIKISIREKVAKEKETTKNAGF